MLHAFKSCSIACQYLALLKWVRRWPNRSSLKSSGAILWPLRQLRVFCMPLMYAATVTFRWSPSVRIYASQITAVQPQLSCRCFQCRGRCRSSTSTKPILTICPMSRATSSTRSVIITKSLCPRIVLACCASCTRMESSSPTLKLCGKEHSHCTPWAQRTVDPKLSLPKIQLLDFLYGEWGVIDTVLVFPDASGKRPVGIREAWEYAVKRAGIVDFRFHDLRHTFASYLAMNGASLLEIAEVLGHKTLGMVKQYAHLTEAHTRSVVERMNR